MATPVAAGSSKSKAHDAVAGNSLADDAPTLLKRGYTLGRLLGEGTYAKVYQAKFVDPKGIIHSSTLACKIINASHATTDFLRRFLPRELEILSCISHQNLVRIHSILEKGAKHFIFMEFCDNGDLLEFIFRNGAIREKQGRIWFCQILRGLHYLHKRDIAHRDMKCENCLITVNMNLKISDFGFARHTQTELSTTFCGSISYSSPEIVAGVPYDPKLSDLWSIGVMLFVMLNKCMPFPDSNLKKLYICQMGHKWKLRDKVAPTLTSEVKAFIRTLLEPIPARRLTVPDLWLDPWIENAPDIDMDLEGIPRARRGRPAEISEIQIGRVMYASSPDGPPLQIIHMDDPTPNPPQPDLPE